MASGIGSYTWSETTDGFLSRREKFRLFAMLAGSQAEQIVSRSLLRLGVARHRLSRVDLQSVSIPDSTTAQAAAQEAERVYSRPLLMHCLRSYLFAVLLGQFHGKRLDREKLYIGCLFHDFGLTPEHSHHAYNCAFEVAGARRAYRFGAEQGWAEEDCRSLYESISLHINPYLSFADHEPEAASLQRGATMDVIGNDRHRVPAEQLHRVDDQYPRAGFASAILATMQSSLHPPDSRAGFLISCGFRRLAARNPLDASDT